MAGHKIDDAGRVSAAGQYVGRVVRLKRRRWVYGRPGSPVSASTYMDAEEAARALLDEIVAEQAGV